MKILLSTATVFLFFNLAVSAQTRKIAFESHSGNAEYFSADIFNEESDFGLPANKTSYAVDSIIKLKPSRYVVVKKVYNKPWADTSKNWNYVGSQHDTLTYDLYTNTPNGFPTDSFRLWLKSWDIINADKINKVIFVGFDDKKNPKQKKEFLPVIIPGKGGGSSSPFDGTLILMITLVFVLSLFGGWISWKLYKPQMAA